MGIIDTNLTFNEVTIIDSLIKPYGVEKTALHMFIEAKGILPNNGLMSKLESLTKRGFLKSRLAVIPGCSLECTVFSLDHQKLYKDSVDRLKTRMIIDRIVNFTTQ